MALVIGKTTQPPPDVRSLPAPRAAPEVRRETPEGAPGNPLLRPLSPVDWLLIGAFFVFLAGCLGVVWQCVHWILQWLFGSS